MAEGFVDDGYTTVNGKFRKRIETQAENPDKKRVSKVVYVVLAVFLGWCGAHRFYAGRIIPGVLSVVFCWTFIPELIAIFDIIFACGKLSDEEGYIWV